MAPRKTSPFKEIPLDLIDTPEVEMRTEVSREGLEALAESLRQHGVINPITVRPAGGRFVIIAGVRRRLAAELADLQTVPCIVLSRARRLLPGVTLAENFDREDVNPIDTARYIVRIIEAEGVNQTEVAARLNRTPAWVSHHLGLLRLPADLQAAVEAGRLSYMAAIELGRVDDPAIRQDFTKHALDHGASHTTVQRWVSDYRVQTGQKQGTVSNNPVTIQPGESAAILPFKCAVCSKFHDSNARMTLFCCVDCWDALQEAIRVYRQLSAAGEIPAMEPPCQTPEQPGLQTRPGENSSA